MYLYTKEKERLKYEISDINRIGGEVFGSVYKISDNACVKIYNEENIINKEILEFLRKLNLKNYYKIYDFFFDKNGIFKAHTMKYYKPEEIDILTMPSLYTLTNLYNLLLSVYTLNKNNILIVDTHTGNIIIDSHNITVIDTDLYTFNRFYKQSELETNNLSALKYLFQELYIEALEMYHPEYYSSQTIDVIRDFFKIHTKSSCEDTFMRLEKYDYPIDYIRKKIR